MNSKLVLKNLVMIYNIWKGYSCLFINTMFCVFLRRYSSPKLPEIWIEALIVLLKGYSFLSTIYCLFLDWFTFFTWFHSLPGMMPPRSRLSFWVQGRFRFSVNCDLSYFFSHGSPIFKILIFLVKNRNLWISSKALQMLWGRVQKL